MSRWAGKWVGEVLSHLQGLLKVVEKQHSRIRGTDKNPLHRMTRREQVEIFVNLLSVQMSEVPD